MKIAESKNQSLLKKPPTLSSESEAKNFFNYSKENNRAFFSSCFIQPKLKIGRPNDKYEQEADRVADAVMRMPDPAVQRQLREEELQMKQPKIQRKCEECENEEKLQKKAEVKTSGSGEFFAGQQLSNRIKSTAGNGNRLPGAVQSEMEQKMGADFSKVSIHTDSDSHQLNRQLGAKAFTHGSDIYFNKGEYNPGSTKGKHLLVHELTHSLQQNSSNTLRRAVQEEDIENGVQQFSTHCGWIDWPHADPRNSMDIIREVRNAESGYQFTARWGGRLHSAELDIEILTNVREAGRHIQDGVSLGIFQTLSHAFEGSQVDVEIISSQLGPFGYRSSYSVEDLPSNLIGFYRALKGFDRDEVCRMCWCWNRRQSLDRYEHDDDRGYLEEYNIQFSPIEYYRGGHWPEALSDVTAVPEGTHWRIADTRIQNTFTLGRDMAGAFLGATRPTRPVLF